MWKDAKSQDAEKMVVNKDFKYKKYIAVYLVVIAVMVAGCGMYLGNYYHADRKAIEAFVAEPLVEMQSAQDGDLVWEPERAMAGFIFYPGGKVDHKAYIPLMESLASEGILCVLTEMPFRLAVFDLDAAKGIQEQYPQIENWYIGGHSLGGAMAASYLSECSEEYRGLILLGSYSTADFSESDISVLSIYGSEDQVLNQEKYEECKVNLPEDFTEVVIDGGCHAYFGMYGLQDGDGTATITNEEQIRITADAIVERIVNEERN